MQKEEKEEQREKEEKEDGKQGSIPGCVVSDFTRWASCPAGLMSKCRVTQNVICRPCHTSLIFTSASTNLWTPIWAANTQTLKLKSLPGLLDGSKAEHLLNMSNL